MSVQEALKLGAYDMKRYANRNLGLAFLIALFIHLVLLGFPVLADMMGKKEAAQEDLTFTGPVTLEDFAEEDDLEVQEDIQPEEIIPPPPPPIAAQVDQGTGSTGAMGNLVVTTEEFEGPTIADQSEISFAREGGGDGGFNPDDFGDLGDMENVLKEREENVKNVIEAPTDKYPEFLPDATNPKYSEGDLIGNLSYPTIAAQEGIEGTVYVKVSIDKTGKIQKVSIAKSTNSIFNENAMDAVRKTTFSPAIQNNYPVGMTITIPVRFKLQD